MLPNGRSQKRRIRPLILYGHSRRLRRRYGRVLWLNYLHPAAAGPRRAKAHRLKRPRRRERRLLVLASLKRKAVGWPRQKRARRDMILAKISVRGSTTV